MSDWLKKALALVDESSDDIFSCIDTCTSISDLRALFDAVCDMPPTQFRIDVLTAIIRRIRMLSLEADAALIDLEVKLDVYIASFGLGGTPPAPGLSEKPPEPDDHGYGR